VRYWVDTFNYATQALDAAAINRVSGRGCQACDEIRAIIRKIDRDRGYMRGASWHLRRTEVLPAGQVSAPQVRAYITFAPSVVLERRGDKPKQFKGGDRTVFTFNLIKQRDRWTVSGIVGVSA